MNFKNLKLKASYDSDEDDILNNFYIPALSEAMSYKRIAGFFTSNSLAIAAKGIAKFISNEGKIQLITNIVLSKEDYEKIKEVTEKPFLEKAEKDFIESLDRIEDELVNNHVKMLGWMLKNGKLEIKVAVVTEETGIQHQKTGILEDGEGGILSFSGSDNETKMGWIDNVEDFHVFCNWVEGDKKHLEADIKRFDKFWNDQAKRTRVFTASDAVNQELIKIAPKTDKEFERLSEQATKELLKKHEEKIKKLKKLKEHKKLVLRPYQNTAVNNWFENNKKGFFRMATGTGKTEAAIGVIERLLKEEESLLIIIVVHGQSLLDQWRKKFLKKYGHESEGASSKFEWREKFRKKATAISLGYEKYVIFVATYQTFSSKDFIEIAKTLACNTLLICDEVHHAGAPEFRKGLIENYSYRLGMSATPERWFDEEGTLLLENYFGKNAYTFSMRRAMSEINPGTGKPYLCGYRYYPTLVHLTPQENEDFIKYTKKIGRRFHALKKFDKDDKSMTSLLQLRANIKKNASMKMRELEKLFNEIGGSLEYCIIYCSEKQIEHVKRLLQKNKRVYSEFTQHQNPKIRESLLQEFEAGRGKGGYDVLLAIDCLNEGIDLPKGKIGIFLDNSQNPIEFIQRRGRLLRQGENKKEAICYDFIVETDLDEDSLEDREYSEVDRKEIQKEFDRFFEFAHLASNVQEALTKMDNIINRYNLIFRMPKRDVI